MKHIDILCRNEAAAKVDRSSSSVRYVPPLRTLRTRVYYDIYDTFADFVLPIIFVVPITISSSPDRNNHKTHRARTQTLLNGQKATREFRNRIIDSAVFACFSISNFITLYSVRALAVDTTRRAWRLCLAFYQICNIADFQQVCVYLSKRITESEHTQRQWKMIGTLVQNIPLNPQKSSSIYVRCVFEIYRKRIRSACYSIIFLKFTPICFVYNQTPDGSVLMDPFWLYKRYFLNVNNAY